MTVVVQSVAAGISDHLRYALSVLRLHMRLTTIPYAQHLIRTVPSLGCRQKIISTATRSLNRVRVRVRVPAALPTTSRGAYMSPTDRGWCYSPSTTPGLMMLERLSLNANELS